MKGQPSRYRAEAADRMLVEPLDMMTLIYQRRSGATHIVAEPIAEILAAMGDDWIDAAAIAKRLVDRFDVQTDDILSTITARLEELAAIGLVERSGA